MYAIKAALRKSRKDGEPGFIVYRLRDRSGAERFFASGIQSTDEEMTTVHRLTVLRALKTLYEIIARFTESGRQFDIDDVADAFRQALDRGIDNRMDVTDFVVNRNIASVGKPFREWVRSVHSSQESDFDCKELTADNLPEFITKLLAEGSTMRLGTVSNYKSARSMLAQFVSTLPPESRTIDSRFVSEFNDWLHRQNLEETTVSFYMRMLSAILNKAKAAGYIAMTDGWFFGRIKGYVADNDKIRTQSLSKDELNLIDRADLEADPLMDLSRDLFMFSFYCRGMELFDILNLTKENICGDQLVFNKRLTGKTQAIRIEPQARRIIEKYIGDGESRIFSAVCNYTASREYATIRRIIAPRIAAMGKLLGISIPLKFSTARNTWLELSHSSNLASLILS